MPRTNNPGGFNDQDSDYFYGYAPNRIVRAADLQYQEILSASNRFASTGKFRNVIYTDASGVDWHMGLVPYVHPAGAGTLTLGTVTTNATTGVVTYTPTIQGQLITELGALAASGETAIAIAGLLFDDYYEVADDNLGQRELGRALTINEGDLLWVQRRGQCQVYAPAAVAINRMLKIDGGGAGKVVDAGASASDLSHTLGDGNHFGLAIGSSYEATAAAGLVKCRLYLPARYGRTNS